MDKSVLYPINDEEIAKAWLDISNILDDKGLSDADREADFTKKLWHTLRLGMTPDEVKAGLKARAKDIVDPPFANLSVIPEHRFGYNGQFLERYGAETREDGSRPVYELSRYDFGLDEHGEQIREVSFSIPMKPAVPSRRPIRSMMPATSLPRIRSVCTTTSTICCRWITSTTSATAWTRMESPTSTSFPVITLKVSLSPSSCALRRRNCARRIPRPQQVLPTHLRPHGCATRP